MIITINKQRGAVLSLEAAILMTIFALSAIGFGVVLAANLPGLYLEFIIIIKKLIKDIPTGGGGGGGGGMCPDGSSPPCAPGCDSPPCNN